MSADNEALAQIVENALAAGSPRPASSPLDEPIDAIVYEVYPALSPRAIAATNYDPAYPYGPPAALPPANSEPPAPIARLASQAADWLSRTSESYFKALQSPPDFVVPKTFGMSAILGIMTALAMLFACLRWGDAEPVFYFFFSVEALTICLAQMLHGHAPRLASIAAGAVILPAFTMALAMLTGHTGPGFLCAVVGFVPFGAVLGYLTGTCAAGVFLVMDYLERCIEQRTFLIGSRDQTCSR